MRQIAHIFTLIFAANGCAMLSIMHTPSPLSFIPGWLWLLVQVCFWAILWAVYMIMAIKNTIRGVRSIYV
jgi:hypothetical protein